MHLVRLTALSLLLLLLPSAAWAQQVRWQPERTRVVIVGVLSWQDPSITTFPAQERKDQELYETLLRRGVPAGNISLLLDSQATRENILATLAAQAAATKREETFIFYYAGHGVKGTRGIEFVPYDFQGGATGLSMEQILTTLQPLQSELTLLFADCCFSGGLAQVAQALESDGRRAASLTSAGEENPSASNWTFTISLLEGLNGYAAADRDQNGAVTLDEIAIEVAEAMLYHEDQENGVAERPWFSDLVMATSFPLDRSLVPGVDRFDYVRFQNPDLSWETGRVIDLRDGNFVVEVQEYSSRREVQVVPPGPSQNGNPPEPTGD